MYSGVFDFFWIIKPNLNQALPMAYTRSLAEWITKPKPYASQFCLYDLNYATVLQY